MASASSSAFCKPSASVAPGASATVQPMVTCREPGRRQAATQLAYLQSHATVHPHHRWLRRCRSRRQRPGRGPVQSKLQRRLQGVLVAADEQSATIQLNDAAQTERIVPFDKIDRARTVFEWGPAPKPGKAPSESKKKVPETSRERRAEKRSLEASTRGSGAGTREVLATSRKRREENQRADEPAEEGST